MNRRVFEDTFNTMKSSLLDRAAEICERQGMTFDRLAYEAQASFQIDEVCREMLFFGANLFPLSTPRLIAGLDIDAIVNAA